MSEPPRRFRQPWRLIWRLPLFFLHVLIGIPVTLFCFLPAVGRVPAGPMTIRQRAHQTWQSLLLRIFGIRLRISGRLPDGPCLVVANHITWLDIVILHALWPMWLVAKAEIARWPLIGALARLAGTLFITRGSTESRRRVARRMSALLKRGERVGIFPEGGIRREAGVKLFHAPLFGPAIRVGVPVVPVAIRFEREGQGNLHDTVVFAPGENFLRNLLRVMAEPPMVGRLMIGPPLIDQGDGRRRLAARAREIVKRYYDD
ncbi:1-acyl-sn-glycerol-3-phosphate acyltransferase [Wenzhouxiangella sp. AB-CW3]|uniref:lysophospholipid acyltransferase family protein n=1 Tax=Wenzhouxiangella sp. AB-CW3 TaxID=2771012 RepID=UPI00168B879F|nr:lysophospholipid acyltransferase family protein [Wenzhouxiangella sp. AB-CW3]QOC21784.1 1-acyl-sn-glycerol-3-phosphate acyltransferase [Wenzhouxiangella sp. AB-CW3]